jgi:hypothetical protein
MISALALTLALATSATQLSIAPWTGKDLGTTTPSAAKFKLTVKGAPNANLRIEATHVAAGWLAAFCTPTVCSPDRVNVTLPASGQAAFSFELIREDEKAAHASGAVITTGDASIAVPPATR